MQFAKIFAIISFAAMAVAAPAPEAAAPGAIIEARSAACPPPNACKKDNKYYKYSGECQGKDSYTCRTSAVVAVANCVNLVDDVNVVVNLIDLLGVTLYSILP